MVEKVGFENWCRNDAGDEGKKGVVRKRLGNLRFMKW